MDKWHENCLYSNDLPLAYEEHFLCIFGMGSLKMSA